jgi:hypothetical protein
MPPISSCISSSTYTPGGCYKGISITGSYMFSPGVYYVAGTGTAGSAQFSISGNGTVTGTGVTIVLFNCANVNISGTTTVQLTAPTSGTWRGILFWQDKASTPCCTSDSFTGGSASSFTGALYFPHGNVDLGGNSGSTCTC